MPKTKGNDLAWHKSLKDFWDIKKKFNFFSLSLHKESQCQANIWYAKKPRDYKKKIENTALTRPFLLLKLVQVHIGSVHMCGKKPCRNTSNFIIFSMMHRGMMVVCRFLFNYCAGRHEIHVSSSKHKSKIWC